MKNNELTEVKPVMPSLEGLPQEVIEYVHGLVAENAALKKFIVDECVIPHEFYGDNKDAAGFMPATPATDAAIAEIKSEEAQNMYESILDNPSVYDMESLVDSLESYAENKKAFAANLRAGRKG
ncbi:hypothetical protein [Rahnella inusitata]|uniref:hypothetical protein n=1 Tax=Rahnella inusitata TaxID=58169 RepID=UPI0039BE4745